MGLFLYQTALKDFLRAKRIVVWLFVVLGTFGIAVVWLTPQMDRLFGLTSLKLWPALSGSRRRHSVMTGSFWSATSRSRAMSRFRFWATSTAT